MERRTAKARAQRIDLGYFQRPHPFRQWRFWLSVAVPVVALAWLLGSEVAGRNAVYDPGPLSRAHAVFSNRCELCHTARIGRYRRHVEDAACLTCHDGPKHQQAQLFTPTCRSCHAEHHGLQRLSEVADSTCTQCHASLRTTRGDPAVARAITSFAGDHPQFRAKLADFRDPGTIKLNHAVHLAPELKGPRGPVQMRCNDCHRATSRPGQFPYAAVPGNDALSDRSSNSPYMAPIKYAEQCAGCHTLEFDRRLAGEQVPHDKPEAIHKFLLDRYTRYIAEKPAALHQVAQLQRIAEQPHQADPRTPAQWVDVQVEDAERLLWQKTCKECHTFNSPADASQPTVPKAAIPQRWFARAAFDHNAHTLVDCESCHAQTRKSTETADVLLPGIETCRQCHQRVTEMGSAADARCFECHQYHNWSQQRRLKAPYTIPQIRGGAPLAGSPVAALR